MVLTFHVTEEIFQMYLHKDKLCEYRTANAYWLERKGNLSIGDSVAICEGYTNNFIHMKIKDIKIIAFKDVPIYAQRFFNSNDSIIAVIFGG
jgi:hypothetical protein